LRGDNVLYCSRRFFLIGSILLSAFKPGIRFHQEVQEVFIYLMICVLVLVVEMLIFSLKKATTVLCAGVDAMVRQLAARERAEGGES
jgi:hypothetical protein